MLLQDSAGCVTPECVNKYNFCKQPFPLATKPLQRHSPNLGPWYLEGLPHTAHQFVYPDAPTQQQCMYMNKVTIASLMADNTHQPLNGLPLRSTPNVDNPDNHPPLSSSSSVMSSHHPDPQPHHKNPNNKKNILHPKKNINLFTCPIPKKEYEKKKFPQNQPPV